MHLRVAPGAPVCSLLAAFLLTICSAVSEPALAQEALVVRGIRVEGLQRTDPGTVFAALPFRIGDTYSDEKGAAALRSLFATGLFTALAEDAANTATVMGFREGDIITATAGGANGPEGVYAFLAWEKGSFKFTPGDPGNGEPLAQSVEHLLFEGCRLLDESRKDEGGSAFA